MKMIKLKFWTCKNWFLAAIKVYNNYWDIKRVLVTLYFDYIYTCCHKNKYSCVDTFVWPNARITKLLWFVCCSDCMLNCCCCEHINNEFPKIKISMNHVTMIKTIANIGNGLIQSEKSHLSFRSIKSVYHIFVRSKLLIKKSIILRIHFAISSLCI